MLPYLISARPTNTQRGDEVVLYLRQNRRSFVKTVRIPHLIPSMRMDMKQAESRLEELKRLFPQLSFELKECGKKKGAIWAKGPREIRELLRPYKYMLVDSIGATQHIRWVAPPFSFVKIKEITTETNETSHKTNTNVNTSNANGTAGAANGFSAIGAEGVEFIKRTRFDDILFEKAVALDIEVEGWREGPGTIYMASFVTGDMTFGNFVLSTYDLGKETVTAIDDVGRSITAQVIYCKHEQEIAAKLTELFKNYDPLWVFGSNVGTYDLLKLRETGCFKPGVLGKEPLIEAQGGFFKRVVIEGRCVVDIAPWSLNWLWLPNNKLTTVGSYLLNRRMGKDLSYEEIDNIIEQQDQHGLYEIAAYNLKDSVYAYDIGREILDHVILSSSYYGISPSRTCTTGKKNIVLDVDKKIQKERMKTIERKTIDEQFNDFDIQEAKYTLLSKFDENLLTVKRGLFRNVDVVYLTPFVAALGRWAAYNEAGEEVYKRFISARDPKKRILFASVLNSFIEKMIYDMCSYRRMSVEEIKPIGSPFDVPDAEMQSDVYFGHKYKIGGSAGSSYGYHPTDPTLGSRPNNFQRVSNAIFESMWKTYQLIKNAEIINYSDRFLFAKFIDRSDLEEIITSALGVYLGKADILSSTKGRIIYRMKMSRNKLNNHAGRHSFTNTSDNLSTDLFHNNYNGGNNEGNNNSNYDDHDNNDNENNDEIFIILSEDADPTGRKGHRTIFEQELLGDFGMLIFKDKGNALAQVWRRMVELKEGKLPREKLLFTTTAGLDYLNFSAPALLQERNRMLVKYGINEGETFSYGYGKVIGDLPASLGKRYPKGYEGDIEAEVFLCKEFEDIIIPAIEHYHERAIGSKSKYGRRFSEGTISDAVYAAFPVRSVAERKLLSRILEGDPTVTRNEITSLCIEQRGLFD